MKKFLLLTIALFCALLTNAAEPAKGIAVLSGSATELTPVVVTAGKSIKVYMWIEIQEEQDFAGLQADLYLPEGVEVIGCKESTLTTVLDKFDEPAASHSVTTSPKGGYYAILINSTNNTLFNGKKGSVAQINLKVAAGFVGGKAQFKNVIFACVSSPNPFDTTKGVDCSVFNIYNADSYVKATGITLSNSSLALNPGQTSQLTATVLPSNATDKSVTWKSTNSSVATVSNTGLVTAVSNGNASITATTADGTNLSASCQVSVTTAPTPSGKAAKGDLVLSSSETSIQTLYVTPGDTKAIAYVYWTNKELDYEFCGFESDIYLPEGVSIVKATTSILTQKEDIFGEIEPTHTVSVAQKSGYWKILCFNSVNTPFSAKKGSVIKLYLSISPDFNGDVGQFKNIIFATSARPNPFDTTRGVDGTKFEIKTGFGLYAENATASKGAKLVLPVLMNNEETISNVQFDIKLPQGIDIANGLNEDGEEGLLVTKGDRAKSSHTISCNKIGDRQYRVVISSTSNATFKDTDKSLPIVNVTLDIAKDMVPGNVNITLDNIVLSHYDATSGTSKYNGAPQTIIITITNTLSISATAENPAHGSVTITGSTYNPNAGTAENGDKLTLTAHAANGYVFWKWTENGTFVSTSNPYTFTLTSNCDIKAVFTKLGDVYEDKIVDVADLTSIVGIILTDEDVDLRTFRAADVYTDGVIDIADYTSTVGIILTSNAYSKADVASANREIANMQFDVELPVGLNITASDLQEMLKNSVVADNHDVAVSMLDNGMIRVLIVSQFNEEIHNAINSLKFLNLVSSTLQGEYDVMLHNMVLAYNDYTKEIIDGMNVKFMFTNPTGIGSISSSDNKNGNIYNLNGQKMNSIHKGVNIVNGKKFIVK